MGEMQKGFLDLKALLGCSLNPKDPRKLPHIFHHRAGGVRCFCLMKSINFIAMRAEAESRNTEKTKTIFWCFDGKPSRRKVCRSGRFRFMIFGFILRGEAGRILWVMSWRRSTSSRFLFSFSSLRDDSWKLSARWNVASNFPEALWSINSNHPPGMLANQSITFSASRWLHCRQHQTMCDGTERVSSAINCQTRAKKDLIWLEEFSWKTMLSWSSALQIYQMKSS